MRQSWIWDGFGMGLSWVWMGLSWIWDEPGMGLLWVQDGSALCLRWVCPELRTLTD